MTGAGMQRMIEKAFFALLCFEINGEELEDELNNLITPEILPALFKLAKRHDLAHLIGDALDKNGLLEEGSEAQKRFLRERNMAVYRYEQIQYEFEQICDALVKAEIAFIPLKGSVIRPLYPEPWMRTSCDIDILVKEENLSAAIEALGQRLNYRYESTGNHDAHLFAESGVHLELHYKLNPNDEQWNAVLTDIWEHVQNAETYHCFLTQEMFYFYHVAHMAGHFKVGGCGVRSFIDLYLLRQHNRYNQETLSELLNKGGLTAFNNAMCAVSKCWFENGEKTDLVKAIENYVLYAGMYGDMKNRVAVAKAKKGGGKLLWSRIFMPYKSLKYQYPKLQKWPILYPFYTIKRWLNLLKKDSRERSLKEWKETTSGDAEKQQRIAKLLEELAL